MPIKIIKEDLVQKRIDSAKKVSETLHEVFGMLKDVPSFKGKKSFVDKIIASSRTAQLLATNLEMDRERSQDLN